MKKLFNKLLPLFIVLSLIAMLGACTPAPVASPSEPSASIPTISPLPSILPMTESAGAQRNLLTVTGTGEYSAVPDMGTMNIGIVTRDKDAKKAQESNNAQMNAIVSALQAIGIESNAITTSGLNMYPQYDYANGRSTLTGYEVSNTLLITINDVSKAGDIVDAAAKAGANQMYGIQFSLKDDSQAYQQALQLAIQRAQLKAQTMAAGVGVKLAGPVTIQEGSSVNYSAYENRAKLEMAMPAAAADAGSAVMAGEMIVTASVTLQYEIIPQ